MKRKKRDFFGGRELLAALEPRVLFSASQAVLILDQPRVLPESQPVSVPAVVVQTGATQAGVPVVIQLLDTASAIQVGDAISLTAIVTDSNGVPLDGQTVSLMDQNSTAGAMATAKVSGGVATFSWVPMSGGLHSLVAAISGQAGYADSVSDPVDLNVYRRAATLDLSAQNVDGKVRLTATAASADALTFAPQGGVDFYDGGKFLGAANLGGQGTSALILGSGTHSLSASYAGSGAFFGASATATFVVPGAVVVSPVPVQSGGGDGTGTPVTAPVIAPRVAVSNSGSITNLFAGGPATARSAATLKEIKASVAILSGSAGGEMVLAFENGLGLRFAQFRQFYEAHLPPALTSPLPPFDAGDDVANSSDAHDGN